MKPFRNLSDLNHTGIQDSQQRDMKCQTYFLKQCYEGKRSKMPKKIIAILHT